MTQDRAHEAAAPPTGLPAVPRVAYFCMEYGLDPSLTIYSGGLGILAGDHMKSVGDLALPVVGLGLFWSEGYVQQKIGADGKPHDHYQVGSRAALETLAIEVEVEVAGRPVRCAVHKVKQHLKSELYLLEPVAESDRWITRRLYGGGHEDRIAQEMLLGIGGVRLLRALGREVDVYHFNEGHAVFAGLELIRERRAAGLGFDQAVAAVRASIVFTTHTPVKAGNETHALALLRRMGADLGHSDEELTRLGGSPFGMTVAGLRLARRANGVARLHGEVAREMWREVAGAAPIGSITNGVHVPTWQDARIRAALAPGKAVATQRTELWHAHQRMKGELLAEIARRTGKRFAVDRLLVGFARRAASYKRADLVLGDPAVLEPWFAAGKLQLVFAGKAHPADHEGKAVIERVVAASRRFPDHVVYLDDYDMALGARLTRGADVWLNNPRRPMEASGTSGMKAAMNGVLNLSILDGWWPEGCRHGETGWAFGDAANLEVELDDARAQALDRSDRAALYRVLAGEVLPRYYDDRARWVEMMQASVAMASWGFSSDRMVEDYVRTLYSA